MQIVDAAPELIILMIFSLLFVFIRSLFVLYCKII